MSETTETLDRAPAPTLKLSFLSHGTLESKDLEFTRRFYEQFFGFEVVQGQQGLASGAGSAASTSMSSSRCPRSARPRCRS